MPVKKIPPDASWFSRTWTRPLIGVFTRMFSIFCSACCMASLALVRFSSLTAMVAWFDAAWDLMSCSSWASARLASSSFRRFFLASMGEQFVLLNIKLGLTYGVFCFEQRYLVLGRLDGGVRLGFDDLFLRLIELRAVLLQVVLLLGGVELDDDVVCLDG